MNTEEEEISLSPRVLKEVENLVQGSLPMESIKAYWDAVKFLATSDFSRESDYAKVFWKDLHAMGNIIIAMHKDYHDRLRKYAFDKGKPPIESPESSGQSI